MNGPPEMPGATSEQAAAPPGSSRWRAIARVVAAGLGLALLVGAIMLALREGGALRGLLASGELGRKGPVLAALVLLPLLNYACSVGMLLVLTRPHVGAGKVLRTREMMALVGSAWLLNYVPLAPGLFGRAAYHARFHGVPLVKTGRVVIESIAIGAAALCVWACVCVCMAALQVTAIEVGAGFVLVAIALSIVPSSWIRRSLRAGSGSAGEAGADGAGSAPRGPGSARYAVALVIRVFDIGVWSVRYAAAFGLLGITISPTASVLFAIVSQLAVLVPLLGNGLGVREWAIGVGAGFVPLTAEGTRGFVAPVGVSADVLNRGAEVVVAIPVGLLSLAWLAMRWRNAESPNQAGSPGVRDIDGAH